jgi:hypothetical protein
LTKGATETTKQGALENIGNVFAILCLSYTKEGHKLLTNHRPGGDGKDISFPLQMLSLSLLGFITTISKMKLKNRALTLVL